ncbi:hypothetical protein CEXT_7071 [Caerostris extrusa]|uniref:Uncharacterized protein n=1 Tax=Caerostris extrusa TaxID=172846 RepID=A0AAV4R8T2_CAEEX|nr:hypothetical protein CEXT_7071 [Caerostris extrusa]
MNDNARTSGVSLRNILRVLVGSEGSSQLDPQPESISKHLRDYLRGQVAVLRPSSSGKVCFERYFQSPIDSIWAASETISHHRIDITFPIFSAHCPKSFGLIFAGRSVLWPITATVSAFFFLRAGLQVLKSKLENAPFLVSLS